MTLDLVLAGGQVVDGTGRAPFTADVGIVGDRIEAIGDLADAPARERVDVAGDCVAPGFIDVHTHSDLAPFLGDDDLDLRLAPLLQGVTTEICGNCGFSVFPAPPARRDEIRRHLAAVLGPDARAFEDLVAFREDLETRPLTANLATLVGHGTVRAATLGFARRAPDAGELRAAEALLDGALADGAIGLSSGLIYAPGLYAAADELVALATVAARHGVPYVTHMRDEMDGVEAAVEEAIGVAAASGAALQISHHKAAGRRNWGRTAATLERIARAREAGIDVALDVYPYTAGSTTLSALMPPWALEGGIDALLARLRDRDVREGLREDFARGIEGWQRLVDPDGGWADVHVAAAPRHRAYEGRSIAELAGAEAVDPIELVSELLLAEEARVLVVLHMMAEQDVVRVLASPLSMIGSDGVPVPGRPHPRWAGSFARVLARYVRRERVLSLEEAVHKMTAKPAERFGLRDRGALTPGRAADAVVFDPESIEEGATYDAPLTPPGGVRHVLLNGAFGVRDGQPTGVRAGRFLSPHR